MLTVRLPSIVLSMTRLRVVYAPLSLQRIPVTYPPGQGEPLNVIISGHSDAGVLVDAETDGGLRNYFLCVNIEPL